MISQAKLLQVGDLVSHSAFVFNSSAVKFNSRIGQVTDLGDTDACIADAVSVVAAHHDPLLQILKNILPRMSHMQPRGTATKHTVRDPNLTASLLPLGIVRFSPRTPV